jgi:uncharacterized protein YndB with AHSA1/START domain
MTDDPAAAAGQAAHVAVVRQRLAAPPRVVYDEWTHADRLAEWMCPRPARCLSVTADARIGGAVRFEVDEDGVRFLVSGNYVTLEPPHRLAFTWSCSTWPDPAVQSLVTVTIDADGPGACVMTIEHALLPSGLTGQHARGWSRIGEQLASAVRGRSTVPGA